MLGRKRKALSVRAERIDKSLDAIKGIMKTVGARSQLGSLSSTPIVTGVASLTLASSRLVPVSKNQAVVSAHFSRFDKFSLVAVSTCGDWATRALVAMTAEALLFEMGDFPLTCLRAPAPAQGVSGL